jgi:ABC-type uncharacterized transport system substrate-binding protein
VKRLRVADRQLRIGLTAICVLVFALSLAVTPLVSHAQPLAKAPRIGLLLSGAAPPPGQASPLLDAFRSGLRDLGYIEGQNVVLEYRWSEGRDERLGELAADLVRRNVAVIVAAGTPATQAAKAATGTIPIVMAFVGDPVGSGFVPSLARPGGNVTGLSLLDEDLDGKRIELLKETVPGLRRLAMVWSANDPGMTLAYHRVARAAQTLGLTLQDLGVRDPGEFPRAFEAAGTGRADALIVTSQPFTNRHRAQILDLAAKQRLPAMYTFAGFVDAGGLMAYAPSRADLFRRAAAYVDKILKGTKPGDLPVEQPTQFELVINLKTAKALGLTIPQSILIRAEVIP